jgi:hypothetical protein
MFVDMSQTSLRLHDIGVEGHIALKRLMGDDQVDRHGPGSEGVSSRALFAELTSFLPGSSNPPLIISKRRARTSSFGAFAVVGRRWHGAQSFSPDA